MASNAFRLSSSIHTAPLFAFTRSNASNTTCLEISYDFVLSTGSSLAVDHFPKLDNTAPSLHRHYRSFITNTGCSAPVLRIGTFLLAGLPLGIFPSHRRTGSQVPNRSLCHVHAASMPATIWTVSRFPPDSSRANDFLPVLMTSLRFRHFVSGSLVFVSIGTHLTRSCLAFCRNAHHHGF